MSGVYRRADLRRLGAVRIAAMIEETLSAAGLDARAGACPPAAPRTGVGTGSARAPRLVPRPRGPVSPPSR